MMAELFPGEARLASSGHAKQSKLSEHIMYISYNTTKCGGHINNGSTGPVFEALAQAPTDIGHCEIMLMNVTWYT